jgi:asparagine synthase (glutamine-hydrolysing)
MCGITGVIECSGYRAGQTIEAMTNSLIHRGPDDEGYLLANLRSEHWIACGGQDTTKTLRLPSIKEYRNSSYNVALGHRRLAILDLSPAGHGPMGYKGGRVWITYNGEVYNYLELREELKRKGYSFETNTDTEVILAAYNEWGTDCLKHFNGMWAFALLDLEAKKIFCSRDRAGVKPFYYFYDGKRLCFASEIKALLTMEYVKAEPNDQMVADYLFSGVLDHTQETFFKDIYQLRPGEYLLDRKSVV